MQTEGTPIYNTTEDLALRKRQLAKEIEAKKEEVAILWHSLATPEKATTKGEHIANLISNSITAIDAFLLVRKLMKHYGNLLPFARRRKSKK
ncbi:MAG: hypothetical protein ACI4BA_07760 [Prevotella sp.]